MKKELQEWEKTWHKTRYNSISEYPLAARIAEQRPSSDHAFLQFVSQAYIAKMKNIFFKLLKAGGQSQSQSDSINH